MSCPCHPQFWQSGVFTFCTYDRKTDSFTCFLLFGTTFTNCRCVSLFQFLQIVILDFFVNFTNCCSKAVVMARGVYQTIYVAIVKIFYFLEIGVPTIFFGKLLFRKTFLCANYSCEYYFVKCLSSHPFLQNVHLDNFVSAKWCGSSFYNACYLLFQTNLYKFCNLSFHTIYNSIVTL